ncbi:MAG: hypothetical protein HIU81_11145 [Acidobacteria bacterium]|nr:hypothetical protein [Acidobacteriota bacterium]
MRLDSRVICYLGLTFLLSTTWSSFAVLGAFSTVATLVLVGAKKLPSVYATPVVTLHYFLTPAVVLASIMVGGVLSLEEHELVLPRAAVYFAVVFVVGPTRHRYLYLLGTRWVGTASSFSGGVASAGMGWTDRTGFSIPEPDYALGLVALGA